MIKMPIELFIAYTIIVFFIGMFIGEKYGEWLIYKRAEVKRGEYS